MHLTDANVRAFPLTDTGQRDYPDDLVRGLSVRVGTQTKSFMLLIRNGPRRSRVKLGTYPECTLRDARELARDRLATPASRKQICPVSVLPKRSTPTIASMVPSSGESIRIRCRYLLDKYVREALSRRLESSVEA